MWACTIAEKISLTFVSSPPTPSFLHFPLIFKIFLKAANHSELISGVFRKDLAAGLEGYILWGGEFSSVS